ncbi:MAG: hypothetical protein R8M14_01470 [Ghiorsea sp.]
MRATLQENLQRLVEQEKLPISYWKVISPYLTELADWAAHQNKPLVLGINGAQGTGKSTLASVLKIMIEDKGLSVAALSLDDFYLSQHQRGILADTIHPLLQTRGVPGTHDVPLAIKTIKHLVSGQGNVLIPQFDKQTDNPKPVSDWFECVAPVDVVFFEGWCVGSMVQSENDLVEPMNALEAHEDKQAVWRKYVNDKLASEYQILFTLLDKLVFLQAPSFEDAFDWRFDQESKTFSSNPKQAMNKQQLKRFMAHYQRLTINNLETLPNKADVTLKLDIQHRIISSGYN